MGLFEALGLGVKDSEGEDEMFGRNKRQNDEYEEDNLYNSGGYDDREEYDDYEEPRSGMFGRGRERQAPVQRTQPAPQDPTKVRVLIYKPLEYGDTQNIIDNLKEKKSIVVNLDDLATDEAQRILDFIAGAVYALNGSIKKAARNIFVVAPYNVDVSANEGDQAEDFSHDQY